MSSNKFLGFDSITISGGGYEAVIIPEIGANLVRLRYKYDKEEIDILRFPQGISKEEFAAKPQVYGIPVLFFPNRISNGTFTKGGRTYRFPQNEGTNFLHGFLHNRPWEVINHKDASNSAEFRFVCGEETDFYSCFPHDFEFTLKYELSAEGLKQTTCIKNGATHMPMGLGYHTTFNIPEGGDYRLITGIAKKWEVDKMLPTGGFRELGELERELESGAKPDGRTFDMMLYTAKPFEYNGKTFKGTVLCHLDKEIDIVYEWGDGFDFSVFWNDEGDKGFVCAEPQTWTIDAPNVNLSDDITGFRLLEPGEKWESTCIIYVRRQ